MISDCPKTGRNLNTMSAYRRILGKCNSVILRDPESLKYVATQMPETNRSLIPDSLFSWFPNYQTGQQQLPRERRFHAPFSRERRPLGQTGLFQAIHLYWWRSFGGQLSRSSETLLLATRRRSSGARVQSLFDRERSVGFISAESRGREEGRGRLIDHFHPYVWCNRSERAAVHLWQISCLDPCIPRRHSMYLPRNTFAQEWQPLALTRLRCSSTVQRVS